MTPTKRRTSRVLLVDDRDRLLLLCGRDPRRPGARWWFTVGGAVEDEEDYVRAAEREVREETALTLAAHRLSPVVWTRQAVFSVDGHRFDQYEEYRLARVTAGEARGVEVTTEEARYGHHWWSLDELATTEQTVRPKRLASHLSAVLAAGESLPAPVHLGDFDEDADPG
jgi:8-oxo-dGTP pyrophosphatase MutT (NUDIX family)